MLYGLACYYPLPVVRLTLSDRVQLFLRALLSVQTAICLADYPETTYGRRAHTQEFITFDAAE